MPVMEPETVIHYEDADGDLFKVEGPFPDGYRFSVNRERVTISESTLREIVKNLNTARHRHARVNAQQRRAG